MWFLSSRNIFLYSVYSYQLILTVKRPKKFSVECQSCQICFMFWWIVGTLMNFCLWRIRCSRFWLVRYRWETCPSFNVRGIRRRLSLWARFRILSLLISCLKTAVSSFCFNPVKHYNSLFTETISKICCWRIYFGSDICRFMLASFTLQTISCNLVVRQILLCVFLLLQRHQKSKKHTLSLSPCSKPKPTKQLIPLFFQFNLKSLLLQEVHMRSAERVKKVRFCLIKDPNHLFCIKLITCSLIQLKPFYCSSM